MKIQNSTTLKTLLFVVSLVSVAPAFAQADKSQYTLWNPTPRELMRPISTDRPDMTESPYTVDAGHFQIETDLLNYSYDRHNASFANERAESWSVAAANVKVGLCNSTDLQVLIPTYNWVRVKDRTTGAVQKNSGFGDIVTRLKINIWGNDGGKTAFGIMPFVKFPTAQDNLGNDAFEGGLILPLAVELPAGWSMGLMTEVDFNEDVSGSGYHPEFINTITFSRGLIGNLGGYVEFFSLVSAESGSDWIGTLNGGLTYAVTDDIQLDAGVNIGVTRAADDFNPFVGITWRF
ncbi:MAG: transporter [Verrucomicrobia bacterium]|nr:transporter [Verrucomicrobiota bacterium]